MMMIYASWRDSRAMKHEKTHDHIIENWKNRHMWAKLWLQKHTHSDKLILWYFLLKNVEVKISSLFSLFNNAVLWFWASGFYSLFVGNIWGCIPLNFFLQGFTPRHRMCCYTQSFDFGLQGFTAFLWVNYVDVSL